MERPFDLSDSAFKVERLVLLRDIRQTSVNVSANDALTLDLCEGPVEPRQQCFNICGVDGCATPDAEAVRCVAVAAEVVADVFFIEHADELLGLGCLLLGWQGLIPIRSDLQADRCVRNRCSIFGEEFNPVGLGDPVGYRLEIRFGALDECWQPADTFCPAQAVDCVFDGEHRDGVDGRTAEDAFDQLAAARHTEDLW